MDQIKELLERGVETVIERKSVEEKLRSGKKLRVKHGVDPTAQDLHLGYTVIYRKLRKLQELGHTIVFLIGNFTARFGDPTDKLESRKMRTKEEVEATAKNYIGQIQKILDVSRLEIRYNGEWYDKMSAEEIFRIMYEFTDEQMRQREMFKERRKKGEPVRLPELSYPVLQGYDSVMLKSNLTVIGTDQIFNELQARPLQRARGMEEQDLIAMKLLVGTDGKRKMSQSYGNYIGLNESPDMQYGKIMSIPDSLILPYFELLTDMPLLDVKEIGRAISDGKNPRDFKMQLGRAIVTLYHGKEAASQAEQEFRKIFQQRETPSDIPEASVAQTNFKLLELLYAVKLTPSKSEARRLVLQGGVKINGKKQSDPEINIQVGNKSILIQVGKRKFLRIKK